MTSSTHSILTVSANLATESIVWMSLFTNAKAYGKTVALARNLGVMPPSLLLVLDVALVGGRRVWGTMSGFDSTAAGVGLRI